jgi:hypothetical protein
MFLAGRAGFRIVDDVLGVVGNAYGTDGRRQSAGSPGELRWIDWTIDGVVDCVSSRCDDCFASQGGGRCAEARRRAFCCRASPFGRARRAGMTPGDDLETSRTCEPVGRPGRSKPMRDQSLYLTLAQVLPTLLIAILLELRAGLVSAKRASTAAFLRWREAFEEESERPPTKLPRAAESQREARAFAELVGLPDTPTGPGQRLAVRDWRGAFRDAGGTRVDLSSGWRDLRPWRGRVAGGTVRWR